MKHIIIKEIPDCPSCGSEMFLTKQYIGEATDEHPFGTNPVWHWECWCGYKSEPHTKEPEYIYEHEEKRTLEND